MRVLILHNAYQQRGGEDAVVDSEANLLEAAGHDVHRLIVSNNDVHSVGDRIAAAVGVAYAADRKRWIMERVRQLCPDIVHIHNFFPLLSPAAHEGAAEAGAAVVQTLHNYRLMCAAATFMRNDQVCTKCLSNGSHNAVIHRCYRGSAIGSAAVVAMQAGFRRHAVRNGSVQRFIVLAEFARELFVSGGLPRERIVVRPNFVPDRRQQSGERKGALFVGRLSAEKDVATLIEAWRTLPDHRLTIVGDGPQREFLQQRAPANVSFVGPVSPGEVARYMASANLLVVPSNWLETFGLVVIEAFCQGLPVLASDIGALKEIIQTGRNGDRFRAGDVSDLAAKARALLSAPQRLEAMGFAARATYQRLYTPERGLETLESVYEDAIRTRRVAM